MNLRTWSDYRVFTLEGALTGLWSKELLRVTRGTEQGCGIIVDIQRLSYIDAAGKEALQALNKRGVSFITDSVHGKDLCTRLKLCRITRSGMEINSGAMAGVDEKRHPSRCGE